MSELLTKSTQVLNLKYDHLKPEQSAINKQMQKVLSGSKEGAKSGITTQTERMVGKGCLSNHAIRLSAIEKDYVISQLMQRNFDKRRGLHIFKSATKRSELNQKKNYVVPPVGFYNQGFYQLERGMKSWED